MIFNVLHIIKEELSHYLDPDQSVKPVVLANISKLDANDPDDEDIGENIVLTLINTKEESTLKNFPNQVVENGTVKYKRPKVFLNLYVLISSNLGGYVESLKCLSRIIEFFQGKKVFTQADTFAYRAGSENIDLQSFRFIVDLHTPSFEELNHIWGTLGGRQLPSLMYKVSIIELERDLVKGGGGLIQEVQGNLEHINS